MTGLRKPYREKRFKVLFRSKEKSARIPSWLGPGKADTFFPMRPRLLDYSLSWLLSRRGHRYMLTFVEDVLAI